MRKDLEELRDLIRPLFEGPYSVYLYGSRAPRAILPREAPGRALRAPLRGRGGRLRRPPDRPLTHCAQVLESGVVLLQGDGLELARLETRLMSMYAALNEERAGILEDIVERGSVYAR